MPWDFDRKMASPTESAVRLDQAAREHSGAGISNQGMKHQASDRARIKAALGRQQEPADRFAFIRFSRDIRQAHVTCQEWGMPFFGGGFPMRVVPRNMISDAWTGIPSLTVFLHTETSMSRPGIRDSIPGAGLF